MALPARELRRIQQQIELQTEVAAKGDRFRASRYINAEKRRQAANQLEVDMIQHHKVASKWLDAIPEAPTFRPTSEQFAHPLAYIRSIQDEAAASGICKIIPPVSAAVPGGLVLAAVGTKPLKFTTRQQRLAEPNRSSFASMTPFSEGTKKYTMFEFEKVADEFARKRFGSAGSLPPKLVEAEYWRARGEGGDTHVEYGNDVEGSAFCARDALGSSQWNMKDLPKGDESVLRELAYAVPGVSSPMLYLGMLFANFAWHVEDHWLYSINYQHLGASKTWYGVPASAADGFEEVAFQTVLATAMAARLSDGATQQEACNAASRQLLKKTTMFSPQLLLEADVKVTRVVQQPGEIVVTFPRSYHAGFSNGFCIGEAVNFSLMEWFAYATEARAKYRTLRRPAIIPFEYLLIRQFPEQAGSNQPSAAMPPGIVQRVLVRHMRSLNRARRTVKRAGIRMQRLPSGMLCCQCSQCGDMVSLAVTLVHSSVGDAKPPWSATSATLPMMHSSPGAAAASDMNEPVQLQTGSREAAGNNVTRCYVPSSIGSEALAPSAVPAAAGSDSFDRLQPNAPKLLCLPCLTEHDVISSSARDGSSDSGSERIVVFIHPDLMDNEALARKLEQDPEASLHGDVAQLLLGGLKEDAYAPLGDFDWADMPLSGTSDDDDCRLRQLEAAISAAATVPDPDALAVSKEKAAMIGDPSAAGELPSKRKAAPAGRSKRKTYHLNSHKFNNHGDSMPAQLAAVQTPPSSLMKQEQLRQTAFTKEVNSGPHQSSAPADATGPTAAAQLVKDDSTSGPLSYDDVTVAHRMLPPIALPLQQPLTPIQTKYGGDGMQQSASEQQEVHTAPLSPSSSAEALTPPRVSAASCHISPLENTATNFSTSQRSTVVSSRIGKRKRKPAVYPDVLAIASKAWEGVGQVKADKRRPSTIAATEAGQLAREAAAAAAAARWDRRPPTFERSAWDERALLNTPKDALLCLEDIMVELSPAAPDLSIRRRIFSPPGATHERYLLAREVVKASGVDYNTSAPNVVQRWFRAIMRRAKMYFLPLPSLPRRALLADVSHSRGCGAAAGVDVLSAEEVMMVAWVVDSNARERLDAFTAGAWPKTPSLLRSRHLQGLLRLENDTSPYGGSKNEAPALVLQHSMAGASNLESALGREPDTKPYSTCEGWSVTSGSNPAAAAPPAPPAVLQAHDSGLNMISHNFTPTSTKHPHCDRAPLQCLPAPDDVRARQLSPLPPSQPLRAQVELGRGCNMDIRHPGERPCDSGGTYRPGAPKESTGPSCEVRQQFNS